MNPNLIPLPYSEIFALTRGRRAEPLRNADVVRMGPSQRDGDGTGCQSRTRSHITVVSPTSISTPFPPPLNRIEWSSEFRLLDPAEGDSFRVILSRAGVLKRRAPRFPLGDFAFRSKRFEVLRDVLFLGGI